MKKLFVALCAVSMMALSASAEVVWTWWPSEAGLVQKVKPIKGAALGIGSQVGAVSAGAEVSLVYSNTPVVDKGAQVAVLGLAKAKSVKWVQAGIVTMADTAKVQIGLLNFNKNGVLPVFIIVNLDKSLFK